MAFTLATATQTRNVWVADLTAPQGGTGAAIPVRQVTAATQAGIPAQRLVEPQLIRYRTFDGRHIPAFLYAPPGARADGSNPAVVLVHGGPEAQVRPEFSAEVQYLTQSGYVVLTPNVRGSTGYGKAYAALDDVERRPDAVADVQEAAGWLVTSGWAHRQRIALMGGSYGGFIVLACLSAAPQIWAAGVDLYGIANFVTFLEQTHPGRRRHRETEYGNLAQDRPLLERLSPLNQVEQIAAPLLAVHGERDPRVPVQETEQIVHALRARGLAAEFIRFPDEGHGIVKLANRLRLYPAIAAFLDRHLKGP